MKQDTRIVVDLGSAENSVLARTIRSMGVYSEIQPHGQTRELSGSDGLVGRSAPGSSSLRSSC